MTGRRRIAIIVGCVVVAALVALYTAARSAPGAPPPAAGSVHLGPEPGQDVPGYLASLPSTLPAPGVAAPALVQFTAEQTDAGALAISSGTALVSAVFRVPVPHVQTALRFEALEDAVPPATALDSARQRAGSAAAADAGRLTGRPRAVAAVESAALDEPSCSCVLGIVVRADGAALRALAARPGVRGVEAAPAGTTAAELALSPLLPEQATRADPLPDDGSVPAP